MSWLPQIFVLHIFGYSAAIARLPSAVASVACCFVLLALAKGFGVRYPLFAVVLFSIIPLQFRYALEARPYAQGVLLSALATLAFLRLVRNPSLSRAVVYTLVLTAGIYSQPFTCFTACAHLAWSLATWKRSRPVGWFTAASLVVAALSFLPWYFYASPLWKQTMTSVDLHFQFSLKTPLLLLREITGAGYAGTCAVRSCSGRPVAGRDQN